MADYYLDSSALLKRYKTENGSRRVIELFESALPADELFTSQFTILEITASIARLRKGGLLDEEAQGRLMNQLLLDSAGRMEVVLLRPELISDAMQYSQKYALKGPDSIQLASAVAARRAGAQPNLVFVAADRELVEAAGQEGFDILNPDFT
jgi:predicted nucleic acid-binding protein